VSVAGEFRTLCNANKADLFGSNAPPRSDFMNLRLARFRALAGDAVTLQL